MLAHVRFPTVVPPSTFGTHLCTLTTDRGRFPAGVWGIVNTFTLGSKDERKCVLRDVAHCPYSRRYFTHREDPKQFAQAMAATLRHRDAQSVLTIAHHLGCHFKPSHFENIVYTLSSHGYWASIPPLVSLAKQQSGRASLRLLNWKLRAYIECHRFNKLDGVMEEFTQDSIAPTRRTFHLLVSGYLRNRDLNSAKRWMEEMGKAGFPPDASTYALIVTAYRSLGLDPRVHARALDSLRDVDARSATRVLNSIVQQLLDVGDESGALRYIQIFSLLSNVSNTDVKKVVAAYPSSVQSGVSAASSNRLTPDAATFTILINYLANQRRLCQIQKLLGCLTETEIKPDSGMVAALIRAYTLNHRDDMAVSLLAAMLHSESAVRTLCGLMGVKLAPDLPIDVKGVSLTVHVFNAILRRIMEIRGPGGARFVFRMMRNRDIRPSEATIGIFLDYLDRTEGATPCQLIHVLQNMSTATLAPTLRHLHVILRSVLRHQKYLVHGSGWDATASKFSPTRDPVAASSHGHRALLSSDHFGSCRSDGLSGRFRYDPLLRSMILHLLRRGVKHDRATVAMRLRHHAMVDPTLDSAKDVLRHMTEQGMHPNQYHYSALMDGYAKGGDMHGAEQTMQTARRAGFKPGVVMYTILIAGYGRQGKPELAMRAFRRMVSAGVAPDVPAIDALAHAYFAVGGYKVARHVLLQLWPQVKPFPREFQNATLKQLATVFRADSQGRVSRKQPLTREQRRLFERKIRGFQREWKLLEPLQGPRLLSRRLNGCRRWMLSLTNNGNCNIIAD